MAAKLTKAQLDECKDAFTVYDTGLKGSIAVKDVGTVMMMCGKNPTNAELEEIIKELSEGKQTIDFTKFIRMMERELKDVDTQEEVRLFLVAIATQYLGSSLNDSMTDRII